MSEGEPTQQEEPVESAFVNIPYEDKLKYMNAISHPVADRKLAKRLFRLLKATSASKNRVLFRQGVKDVQKYIKRGEKGIVILAGNVTPIDTYSHIPVFCEENGVRYVFVPCKEDLQLIVGARSGVLCLMINRSDEDGEIFDKCSSGIDALHGKETEEA